MAPSPDQLACLDAFKLARAGQNDQALAALAVVLKANPKNIPAYMLQGQIYSALKRFPDAQSTYEAVLKLDDQNTAAKFDLGELLFLQKEYDQARPSFVDLSKDPILGDLASYKVFLCDLFAGKEDAAKAELDGFTQEGNASYFFGNVAWSLYHHQEKEARGYLTSAVHIFAPGKLERYSYSLRDLGYLPLPAEKPDSPP